MPFDKNYQNNVLGTPKKRANLTKLNKFETCEKHAMTWFWGNLFFGKNSSKQCYCLIMGDNI